ncbi:transcriptional repressor [Candidatus Altiarchaeota archaeon]
MTCRRSSIHRTKILDYLKSVRSHPTAGTVYENIKKQIPSITLATTYRNLNILTQEGFIEKLEINGEYRFDADTGSHIHCICEKCGKITDIHQKDITEYAISHINHDRFKPNKVNITYNGECIKNHS